MKCMLCYKSFEGSVCPVCGFPVISIPGTSPEEIKAAEKNIKDEAEKRKGKFINSVEIALLTYCWSLTDGKLEFDGEEELSFGKLDGIMKDTSWLSRKFDNISERNIVDVDLVVKVDGDVKQKLNMKVPNMTTGEWSQVGISADNEMNISVKVRNDKKMEVTSEKCYLFD